MSSNPLLEGLTQPQRQAVVHGEGPLLVLAGPGSGKTRVIVHRIAHLVSLGVPPWSILSLTFTNKAAGEMRRRVEALLPADLPDRARLFAGTFHSFGARVLRRYAVEAGLDPNFNVLDVDDQRAACKAAIKESGESESRFTPAGVLGEISSLKNKLVSPDEAIASATDWRSKVVSRIYAAYQKVLSRNAGLDFDDLLGKLALLLRTDEGVRDALRRRFQYVMVDEYQDTNYAQFAIVLEIAREHRNLCVVGDPDQSIYGWRGADIGNILGFEEHFPGAKVVPLGENFRSTRPIVEAAAALISRNRQRRPKELKSMKGEGEAPAYVRCEDEHAEAALVADRIQQASDQGIPWRGVAVLYRMNALSRVMEEALRRRSIPYQVVRGTAFYDRREVRDLLAYLRLAANPSDDLALQRIVNTPTRGLGSTSFDKIEMWAAKNGETLLEGLRHAEKSGATKRAAHAAAELAARVASWRHDAENGLPGELSDFVARILKESGLESYYLLADRTAVDAGESRTENLAQVVSASADFVVDRMAREGLGGEEDAVPPLRTLLDALRAYLEQVSLVADSDAFDPELGAVTLMTLHASKGLEFPFVCIIGVEQGSLPHARSFESAEQLEEERRLLFVGMTRAERTLLITAAGVRTQRGIPMSCIESSFIRELPEGVTREDRAQGRRREVEDFDGEDAEAPDDGVDHPAGGSGMRAGMQVRHPLFGRGVVESLSPRGSSTMVRVRFQKVGVKSLVLEFARLQVVG
ncbi:MAG: UvrD-helicase domain-containing protein [Planctomycetes bacterium]|nr:UvrD-helicase domain-containing protein [Planctomycetota bacterium]